MNRSNALCHLLFLCLLSIPLSSFSQSDGDIMMCGIFSLTGFGNLGGSSERNGALLAVEDINREGGIRGKKVVFVVEDSRSNNRDTVSAFKKLVLKGCRILIGPNWVGFSEVVAPLAERSHVIMITPTGWTNSLTKGRRYVFSMSSPHYVDVKPLVDYVVDSHFKKIAIVTSINTYFESISYHFKKQVEARGVGIIYDISVNPNTWDFRSIISKLKSNKDKIDAVGLFLSEGGDNLAFFKQAKELNLGIPMIAADITYEEALLKNLSVAEGVVFFKYLPLGDPSFRNRYLRRFKTVPLQGSPLAYDAVYAIKESIESCGNDVEKIIACLHKLKFKGVSGEFSFNKDGEIKLNTPITGLFSVKGGKVVPVAH